MSIINILIETDRALIGTDTLVSTIPEAHHLKSEAERRDKHIHKFAIFPHINTVMTARGEDAVSINVRGLLEQALPANFDEAVTQMPWILNQAYQFAVDYRKTKQGIEAFHGSDIALVGWSDVKQRFVAVRWRRYPQDADFQCLTVGNMLVTPEIDLVEPVMPPNTDSRMVELMRRQVAYAESQQFNDSCGGRVLMVELKRHSLTVRTIADLSEQSKENA